MKKQLFITILFLGSLISYGQNNGNITVSIIQPEVYVVKDKWFQQINFDFNIENNLPETIELNEIELYIYDENEQLISLTRRYDGGVSSSIRTIPVRKIKENEKLTVYNPFTVFSPYMDLHHLRYKLFFDGELQSSYIVEVDLKPELYITKTELHIPLKGKIFILDGNDLYSNHRRFDINDPVVNEIMGINTTPGLFAIDFSVIDSLGEKYSGERENNNYYIFGKTVFAPAGGRVIKANDLYEDNKPGSINFSIHDVKANKDLLSGNSVVIDHLNGEYSFLVHLKKGSLVVEEGQMVTKGQPLGQVGNSGSSMYPHLHYQLSDGPDYIKSNGLPVYFNNYNSISDNRKVNKGYLNTGDLVEYE